MPRTISVLTLATTNNEFNNLWKQVYANRSDVGITTVNKKALMHLLYDHAQLVGFLQEDFSWLNVELEQGDRDAQEESLLALKQYRDIMIEKDNSLKLNNEILDKMHPDVDSSDPEYHPFDVETETQDKVTENDGKADGEET